MSLKQSYSEMESMRSRDNFMRLSLTAKPEVEVDRSSTSTSRTSRKDMLIESDARRKPRVLLVDDVAVDRKMNARLLLPTCQSYQKLWMVWMLCRKLSLRLKRVVA